MSRDRAENPTYCLSLLADGFSSSALYLLFFKFLEVSFSPFFLFLLSALLYSFHLFGFLIVFISQRKSEKKKQDMLRYFIPG